MGDLLQHRERMKVPPSTDKAKVVFLNCSHHLYNRYIKHTMQRSLALDLQEQQLLTSNPCKCPQVKECPREAVWLARLEKPAAQHGLWNGLTRVQIPDLLQWSPSFLALGTGFMEDNFPTMGEGWDGSGWFKSINVLCSRFLLLYQLHFRSQRLGTSVL